MITGIAPLAFRITNLERALDFYCRTLGFGEAFRLDSDGQPSPWIVYLQVAPGQFLELFPGAEKTGSQSDGTFGYNHFSLRIDDMHATLRNLSDRGLSLSGEPSMGLDNNWQYWITDPDGNRVELMQIMSDSPQAADTHWQERSGRKWPMAHRGLGWAGLRVSPLRLGTINVGPQTSPDSPGVLGRGRGHSTRQLEPRMSAEAPDSVARNTTRSADTVREKRPE